MQWYKSSGTTMMVIVELCLLSVTSSTLYQRRHNWPQTIFNLSKLDRVPSDSRAAVKANGMQQPIRRLGQVALLCIRR